MIKSNDYYETDLKKFVDVFQMGAVSMQTADTCKVKDGIILLMQNTCLQYLSTSSLPLPNKVIVGSIMLTPVCKHMLFGCGIDCAEKHVTKQPIAEKFGIPEITPQIIAYAASSEIGIEFGLPMEHARCTFLILRPSLQHPSIIQPAGQGMGTENAGILEQIFYSEDGAICTKHNASAPPPKLGNNILHAKKACWEHLCKEKQHCEQKEQCCEQEEQCSEQEEVQQQQPTLMKRIKQQNHGNQSAKQQCLSGTPNSDMDDVDGNSDSEDNGDGKVDIQ
ncbi:hypothetical protein C0995_003712 [Termitomyces sp. Mi166|nr:hypothetical protein C0995_003712 [Termitomyces sp. Mi166\